MLKPQYTQKFRQVWLKDPLFKVWLTSVETTAGYEARCKFCGKILTSRYADLKSHGESQEHKSNASLFLLESSQPKIPFVTESTLEAPKIAEARLAVFVVQHTSINIVDHLTDLCKNIFKGDAVDYLRMHLTKCGNIMAPFFIRVTLGHKRWFIQSFNRRIH